MLRVGLTGDLASGKSTVATMLAAHGAIVLSSDEMARALMQPGQPVFDEIVSRFGAGVLTAEGELDRRRLAALAFDPANPRVDELNAIIHPPVLARQAAHVARLAHTDAVVVIESALILSVANWRDRFDVVVLVTATDEAKIARFLKRSPGATEAEARRRLDWQSRTAAPDCIVLRNDETLAELQKNVDALWSTLAGVNAA